MAYKVTYLAWRRGKKWRLAWRNGGERIERYFATEEEARAYAEEKSQAVLRERRRVARARKEAKRSVCRALTVDELLDAYLARDGIREITRKADIYHAVHLRRLLGHRRATRLTEADAKAFMVAQRERGLMQTTVNRRVKILRAAYSWAVREGMLRSWPAPALCPLTAPPPAHSRRTAPNPGGSPSAHPAPGLARLLHRGAARPLRAFPADMERRFRVRRGRSHALRGQTARWSRLSQDTSAERPA